MIAHNQNKNEEKEENLHCTCAPLFTEESTVLVSTHFPSNILEQWHLLLVGFPFLVNFSHFYIILHEVHHDLVFYLLSLR